jgi:hypothetical protein
MLMTIPQISENIPAPCMSYIYATEARKRVNERTINEIITSYQWRGTETEGVGDGVLGTFVHPNSLVPLTLFSDRHVLSRLDIKQRNASSRSSRFFGITNEPTRNGRGEGTIPPSLPTLIFANSYLGTKAKRSRRSRKRTRPGLQSCTRARRANPSGPRDAPAHRSGTTVQGEPQTH